ncbi:Peroxiredoxin [unidentified eubacterium SCB49]|nr:Peroxiredoxin [unidentified eubacterium SCB49]
MAQITLGGNPIETIGELPQVHTIAPEFTLSAIDLTTKTLEDFKGKKKILNIFPSVDTGVCAASARNFNEKASSLDNTVVLCISRDLPFAQARFCGAEGLENVTMLSDFKDGCFGVDYGVTVNGSPFDGLHARAIVVLNEDDGVLYTEQVKEIGDEPNYEAAINALS